MNMIKSRLILFVNEKEKGTNRDRVWPRSEPNELLGNQTPQRAIAIVSFGLVRSCS